MSIPGAHPDRLTPVLHRAQLRHQLLQQWWEQCCAADPQAVILGVALWDSLRLHHLYHPQLPGYHKLLGWLQQRDCYVCGQDQQERSKPELVGGLRLLHPYPPALDRYRGIASPDWIQMPAGHAKYLAYINQHNPVWEHRRRACRRQELCQGCGQPGDQVHHLSYRWLYFERAQDLQLLCRSCHQLRHDHQP